MTVRPVVRLAAAALLLGALTTLPGCAAMSVKPWDRDLLSERKMSFNPLPMHMALDDHVYFSKEGSMGGQSVGGGGCGCN